MGDRIAMSGKERERLVELAQVKRGEESLAEAGRRLGLSYRQAKRIWRRYRESGAAGLVHGGRGRSSNRGKEERFRQECVEEYRQKLEGFGPTLASEKLEKWGRPVDHETLRRWLVAAGLWQVRRRRQRHRRWRPRKEHFGEMVQLDGSFHDWFERRDGVRDCLLSMIDDATGVRMSGMKPEETTAGAMGLLWQWIVRHGIPRSLYVDRKTVYITDRKPTIEEELAGESPLTAFGQVCRKLGIEILAAHSPQAKGRIERSHGVYQDRLVKEIRLRGLRHRDEVNALLGEFDQDLNRRFAVAALSNEDFHRPVPRGIDLAGVFVWEQTRTVQHDWTVRFENRWYQILGPKRRLPPAKGKVVVQRRLDGSLHLLYRGRRVHHVELPQRPAAAPRPATEPQATKPRQPWHPPADHPWRRPLTRRAAWPAHARADAAAAIPA